MFTKERIEGFDFIEVNGFIYRIKNLNKNNVTIFDSYKNKNLVPYSEIENIYSKNHWTIDFKEHETVKAI